MVVPEEKIAYNWTSATCLGESVAVFELFPEGKWTTLRLTTHVLESFPDDIPEFATESCIAGWEYFIKGNLKAYLESA